MKYSIVLILTFLFNAYTYAQNTNVLNLRNTELLNLKSKHDEDVSEHNKIFVYQTENGNPGVIYQSGIDLVKETAYKYTFIIPNSLELRFCQTPPNGERVIITNTTGDDFITLYSKKDSKVKLVCSSQDSILYSFISYKE